MMTRLTFVMALIGLLVIAPLTARAQSKKTTKTKTAGSSKVARLTPAEEKELAAAKKTVSKLTTTQKFKLLDVLNKGDKDAILALPSIGETRAASVMKARPFKAVEDLIKISGIGQKGLSEIVAYGRTLTKSSTRKSSSKSPKKKLK